MQVVVEGSASSDNLGEGIHRKATLLKVSAVPRM